MTDTKAEIRDAFREMGMNPEKIRHQPELEYYEVYIGVEGTDDQFLEEIQELGGSSGEYRVDSAKVVVMTNQIEGTEVSDGVLHVRDTMVDSHFQIEVV
jgi:hypothetical protein